jgi:hypothetical protein
MAARKRSHPSHLDRIPLPKSAAARERLSTDPPIDTTNRYNDKNRSSRDLIAA